MGDGLFLFGVWVTIFLVIALADMIYVPSNKEED
jgi:hypothetical protein